MVVFFPFMIAVLLDDINTDEEIYQELKGDAEKMVNSSTE